jgi:hypothetical protein
MSTFNDADLLMVQRGADKYSASFADLQAGVLCGYIVKSDLPPDPATDPCIEEGTIWVDTGSDPPKINVWDPGANGGAGGWIDGGTGGGGGTGPGVANPLPGQTTAVPPFEGGTGTIDSPYILTAATAFAGGKATSAQTITFQGQPVGSLVSWVDNNSATNGGRYNQPIGTVNSTGLWSGKLGFYDAPAVASMNYTGLLMCGGVYFSWGVTTQSKGVETPSILEVMGTDGSFYAAPTGPSYVTATAVGSVYTAAPVSGLTVSAKSDRLSPVGGSGTGLEVEVSTDENGAIALIEVLNGGAGYVYDEEVMVNLTSIGGASSQAMKIRTHPVTTAAPTFKVTPFAGINAGTFVSSEWQIDTTPAFLAPSTVVSNSTGSTVTIGTGKPQNTEFYVRFRYTSSGGVTSEFSSAVRCATGSLIKIRYILKSFAGAEYNGKSFDTGDIFVSPKPYLYLVLIDNKGKIATDAAGLNNQGTSMAHEQDSSRYLGNEIGRFAAYLQLRQPAQWVVTGLLGSGSVDTLEPVNNAFGLNDCYDALQVAGALTGGSGTGCTGYFKRDASGKTILHDLATAGTNYKINDVLTFTPFIGDGNAVSGRAGSSPSVNNLDSVWDVLLQGCGGPVGAGGGYLTANGATRSATGTGGVPAYQLYCGPTGSGTGSTGTSGGTAGGCGWGPGQPGRASDNNPQTGGGGASYLNPVVSSGQISNTAYTESVEVLIRGISVENFSAAMKSYRLF